MPNHHLSIGSMLYVDTTSHDDMIISASRVHDNNGIREQIRVELSKRFDTSTPGHNHRSNRTEPSQHVLREGEHSFTNGEPQRDTPPMIGYGRTKWVEPQPPSPDDSEYSQYEPSNYGSFSRIHPSCQLLRGGAAADIEHNSYGVATTNASFDYNHLERASSSRFSTVPRHEYTSPPHMAPRPHDMGDTRGRYTTNNISRTFEPRPIERPRPHVRPPYLDAPSTSSNPRHEEPWYQPIQIESNLSSDSEDTEFEVITRSESSPVRHADQGREMVPYGTYHSRPRGPHNYHSYERSHQRGTVYSHSADYYDHDGGRVSLESFDGRTQLDGSSEYSIQGEFRSTSPRD